MKKGLGIVVIILALSVGLKAQVTQKGSSTLQFGYGFPSTMYLMGSVFKYGLPSSDSTATSSFRFKGWGPLHFRYEYMVSDKIGIGLSVNAEFGKFRFTSNYHDNANNAVTGIRNFKYSSINGILRLNYHFVRKPEKVDIYYGFGVGYAHTKVHLDTLGGGAAISPEEKHFTDEFDKYLNGVFKKLPIALEQVIGIKVPLTESAGVYMEAGYSKSLFQVGFYGKLGGGKGFSRDSWRWYKN